MLFPPIAVKLIVSDPPLTPPSNREGNSSHSMKTLFVKPKKLPSLNEGGAGGGSSPHRAKDTNLPKSQKQIPLFPKNILGKL
jgi:hypothetical protein